MSGNYKELGLESLQSRRWCRKMKFFYKTINGLTPKYLFDITPVAIQELSQSWKLLNWTAEQQASVALSFPSVMIACQNVEQVRNSFISQ